MNPTNNNTNVDKLQFKIDEKLNELKKRQLQQQNANAKAKKHSRIMHHIQWSIIKRQSLQQQHLKQHKSDKNNLKMVKPFMRSDVLMDTINRVMILQHSIIELGQNIADYRRLQMCWIFIQCSLSIIFNAYNLVVFLLKIVYHTGDVPLTFTMLLLFYGYHIINPLMETIISVLAYRGVYSAIRRTASIVDEINMYILDMTLNNRLSQFSSYVYNNLRVFNLYGLYNLDGSLLTSIISGTTTYIIILIQYSGDGEICTNAINMNDTKKMH